MLSVEVDDLRVVENVYVPSKTATIIVDITVNSGTPIIDEIHVSSDSTSDNVDEIVEPNAPTMPSKLFEFPCVAYNFMVIPIDSSSSELPEFLAMI